MQNDNNDQKTKKAIKKEVQKAAEQSILSGKSKQETFETLKETCELSTEDLAKIIQTIPSLDAREKYRSLNTVLLSILILTVFFKIIAGLPILTYYGIRWLPILFFLPAINIILLIGVANYKQGSHKWVSIVAIISLLRLMVDVMRKPFEAAMLIDVVIAFALIVLGFYLNSRLYPKYLILKNEPVFRR